ncbi:MAG TPA: CHASE2 domain-containing protein, partial [Candidatus Angelobacter sp.]|nr:CHASE2 domain-containing protein [Candidatus Angelobacter sp.]
PRACGVNAMQDAHSRPGFVPYALRGAVLVLVATAITAALHHTWFVQRLELTNLDALLVVSSGHQAPDITIVEISDDDYADKKMFGGVSPLKPAVVAKLIQAIDTAGARAIGVDILTADWPADSLQNLHVHAPVVWVRGVEEIGGDLRLDPIMSGDGHDVCQGPPALEEVDGVARKYFPALSLNNSSVSSFTTVFKRVIQDPKATCNGEPAPNTAGGKPSESRYIGFLGGPSAFQILPAGTVLAGSESPEWSKKQLLKDRIVLLGGAYRYARDRYATPLGDMYGVEILGNILASEMTNAIVKEAGLTVFIIADLLLGFGIITLAYYLPRTWSLPATLLGAPIVAVALNMLLFVGWRYYLSFMPVVVGVIVHSVAEHVREHRQLLREQSRLQERNASLQLEVEKLRAPGPSAPVQPTEERTSEEAC